MNASFWFFPLSALINVITTAGLGLFLLATHTNKRVARYLVYYCVTVAMWSIAYFLWQVSEDASSAFMWAQILMVPAIFTSVSYFHLVLVFLKKDKQTFYKIVLAIFYILSVVWSFLVFTDYFIVGVEHLLYFKYWPIAGPMYAAFLVSFFFHVLYASVLLLQAFRKKKGQEKTQIGLLLVGIFVAFVGGSTNYFLWYHIPIAPWGNALVSVFVILTVYAMTKYKFLDLRVVSAEIFTTVLFGIFAIDVFLSKSVTEFIFRIVGLVVMGFFGAILIKSVRREVDRREEVTQMAHSLEKANVRLQELDRQKTEFLSIASHQLRTPLSIIKGYIELIQDGAYGRITKKTHGILQNMDESNERLVKLVDEFLNITRIEQGRTTFSFDMHNMNDLVSSVVAELKERAEGKGLHIVWKENTQITDVYMDEEKIRHVVFNYIDNAIKYSEKGTITVSTESEKKGVTIRVRDEGLGFNREDDVNFFQKFYRGKNVQGTNVNGTGLGIYVCRKFIEAHNGHVWAKSKGLGKGSEFGFWFAGTKAAVNLVKKKEALAKK